MVSQKLILSIICIVLDIAYLGLAWYWFGWKLALILFLLTWSSNIFMGEIKK